MQSDKSDSAGIEADLRAYFGDGGAQHGARGDAFLQHFLSRRLWAEDGDDAGDSRSMLNADVADAAALADSDDDAFLDNADDFERSYNFRCASSRVPLSERAPSRCNARAHRLPCYASACAGSVFMRAMVQVRGARRCSDCHIPTQHRRPGAQAGQQAHAAARVEEGTAGGGGTQSNRGAEAT